MTKNTIQDRPLWGIGLSDIERMRIEAVAPGHSLHNFGLDSPPLDADAMEEDPLLVFIPQRVWASMPRALQRAIINLDPGQKVCLVDADFSLEEADKLLDKGFLSVVRSPITSADVHSAIDRAEEVADLYADIVRMTREISLEREILTRKTDHLLFLNNIMSNAAESLNPATILNQARKDLSMLFPVISVQGIFWHQADNAHLESEIFLTFQENTNTQDRWLELMLGSARRMAGAPMDNYQLTFLMDAEAQTGDHAPRPGRVVMMPLKVGGEVFGAMSILTSETIRLGKDQQQVLHSAVNHLGLALKNALLYREVKMRADHDGLTRIHNRQIFDERMAEELSRARRYKHEISLLMIDLDHFKAVNDTYGHQAGDLVLKELGGILHESLRDTDFAARYGGEEFAVILPHTRQDDAFQLADRLREKVEDKRFLHQGKTFTVTASIGVASLSPEAQNKTVDLLNEADKALYKAKDTGRNRVCTATQTDVLERETVGI